MPRTSPYIIQLSNFEKTHLETQARKYTSPYYSVLRARIILLAAQGRANDQIAASLSVPRQIVSKWRKRFFEERLAVWRTNRDPGDRPFFPPEVVVQVKALACELPAETELPLSRFSRQDLAREVVARGIVAQISGATIWRWLDQDAIRPCNTAVGFFPAMRSSSRRPDACWISTRVAGKTNPWAATNT